LKVECAPLDHICGSFYNGLCLYKEHQIIYCLASLPQFNSRPQWLIFMCKGSSFSKEYPESVDNPHFTLVYNGSIAYFTGPASTNWKPIGRHICFHLTQLC